MHRPYRLILSAVVALAAAWPPMAAAGPGLPSTNVAWLTAAGDADIDARIQPGQGRGQAAVAVLGRDLVPAVQPVEGHAVQPPGLRHAEQGFRGGACRWRPAGGAEARCALQGRRLPDDDPVHPRRQRDHPPAWRSRCAAGDGPVAGRPGGWPPDRQPCWPTRVQARRSRPTNGACCPSIPGRSTRAAWSRSGQRPAVLAELAARSPAGDSETTTRLWLKALAASDDGKGAQARRCCCASVCSACSPTPALARTHMDVLIYGASDIVKVLSGEDGSRARHPWWRSSTPRWRGCRPMRRCRAATASAP